MLHIHKLVIIMKFIRRPKGRTHAVIGVDDLDLAFESSSLSLSHQVRKESSRRSLDGKHAAYLVTFSENRAPEWMTLETIERHARNQWEQRNRSRSMRKKTSKEKSVTKKVIQGEYTINSCSVHFATYLEGFSGEVAKLRLFFSTDLRTFQILWTHLKCYNDAMFSCKFIVQHKHLALLAMRAVTFARTEEQIAAAKKLLPNQYKKYSTEQIKSFMKGLG